ncbi:Acetylesterase [Paramyrothecium foliicola]|nr:Acetylesterase [Paramyrothecium foliicola]
MRSYFTALCLATAARLVHAQPSNTTKKVFFFGDSFTTTEYDPYGEQPSAAQPLGNPPLPGRTRSGGLNFAGILLTELQSALTLGYNYAFSGGIVDKSIIPGYGEEFRSFTEQIDLFKETEPSIQWTSEDTLAGALFGFNDIWSENLEGRNSPVEEIVASFIEQFRILYNTGPGVRNFFAITLPPVSRSPFVLALTPEDQTRLGGLFDRWNSALVSGIDAFAKAHPDAVVRLIDSKPPFLEALNNPTKYGAPDNMCYNSDGTSCLWWDTLHPGVEIHRLLAKEVARTWADLFFKAPSDSQLTRLYHGDKSSTKLS